MFFLYSCGDSCDDKFQQYFCGYSYQIPGTNMPFLTTENYNLEDWNILIDIVNEFDFYYDCLNDEIINNPSIIGDQVWENHYLTKLVISKNNYGTSIIKQNCVVIGYYNWEISEEIINLINNFLYLDSLILENNEFQLLPENLCNLNDDIYISINNNNICPPYPECLTEQEIGQQYLSNCP